MGPTTRLPEDTHVVLGISGGVAAYKAVEVCRRLTSGGARVTPVLTENARRFIGTATFRALATEEPVTDLWSDRDPSPHTTLARSADLVLVVPATARIVASLAHGSSDDVLATVLLATRAPVVLCPAMHTEMWEHPGVVANIATLRSRGVTVVEPGTGPLAGGDSGVGRLAPLDSVMAAVHAGLGPRDLSGRRFLVTAGGTREPIDPVRYIGNRSSGKQGHAIAAAAAARGAEVTLISASPDAPPDAIAVGTAEEMHAEVMRCLAHCDVVVMAAAVADFRPVGFTDDKIKKADGVPRLELEPTVDILGEIALERTGDQVIVGFAAETRDVESAARSKLAAKHLDLIAANDVAANPIGLDTNAVTIIGADGRVFATDVVDKTTVAHALLDRVVVLLASK